MTQSVTYMLGSWWQVLLAGLVCSVAILLFAYCVSSPRVIRKINKFERKHPRFFNYLDKHDLMVQIFVGILVVAVILVVLILMLNQLASVILEYPDIANATMGVK